MAAGPPAAGAAARLRFRVTPGLGPAARAARSTASRMAVTDYVR